MMLRPTASAFAILTVLLPLCAPAQMDHGSAGTVGMAHKEGPPSTSLRLNGLDGRDKTLTVEEFKALPHVTVSATNGHSHKQETYSGVAVRDLLALVAAPKDSGTGAEMKPRPSPRMTIVIAQGTDKFRVIVTLCDTDPECRSGQAIVADSVDGHPLTTDGAFKLILTEDKMPGRWVRNLDALTVRLINVQSGN